ncbi:MAG: hypothetical protein HYV38_03580, partial [Candidatus Levybacteria bacterium]|nr:hypothetical protein [Candidatus Levybacteria bacterium]
EQDEVLVSIASQNEKAVGLNVVKERSGAISDILKSRVNYNEIIDLILSKKPIGLPTTSLSIDKDSVSITVSSLSLLLLNEYLSELVNISLTDDRLSNLSVETLSANQSSGEYSLSIKALLNGPKN